MNTETQGATSIVESPNNEFNNRSALAFTDLRISEETEENAEIEAVPAGSATMSTTLDVGLEKSSFKAFCRSCRAEITLSHPFYTCIPYSINHPSKHPGRSYDVCLTCQASVKTCPVHKRVLHRIDVVWHNGKPFDRFHINRGEEPGDSALVAALKARDLDRLNRLAKIPGLMDASDVNGHAPLHIAATLGFEAEVRCLIKNGADLETKNVQSQTPLFSAIGAQELSIAILLIESGANKAAIDGFLMSPLHFACSLSLTEAVAMLLSTEPAENIGTYADQTPDNGDSALLLACENGNFAIVRALLEAGADPNLMARNESGHLRPGSHRLPESQQGLEILRLLAEFGADFWRKDTSGWTQLHMNAFSGRADLCRELFNISTNSDQLKSSRSAAADVGNRAAHWDTLKTQLNADPNAITNNAYTALFLGASNGHANVCRTLLEFGANPSITAKPRRPTFPASFSGIHTPLTSASYHGHEDVVSALISFGASVGPILGGTSPLLEATRGGYLRICEKLITAGADMNWCHGDQTALSNAAEYGRVRIVHMLFKKGARAWPLKNNGYRKKLFFEPGVDQQSRYRIAQAFKAQKLVYTRSAKTPIS
jgi:ankyrin repeat protein